MLVRKQIAELIKQISIKKSALNGSYCTNSKQLTSHSILMQKMTVSSCLKSDQKARLMKIQNLAGRILYKGQPIFLNTKIKQDEVHVSVSNCTSLTFKSTVSDTNLINSLFDAFVQSEKRKLIGMFKFKNEAVFASDINDLVDFTGTKTFFKGREPNQKKPKTKEEIKDIFNHISCNHPILSNLRFRFSAKEDADKNEDIILVQAVIDAPCVITGEKMEQRGGKNYISGYSMEDELVQKALGMCISVLDHELRETVSFIDDHGIAKKIFYPHMVLSDLIKFKALRKQSFFTNDEKCGNDNENLPSLHKSG